MIPEDFAIITKDSSRVNISQSMRENKDINVANKFEQLPRKTGSLCPVCKLVIEAELFERDGKIWIKKQCKEHGLFEDIYWSDAEMYLRFARFGYDGAGVDNPQMSYYEGCPFDCGLCNLHLSHTCLANIDVTNRCNMQCDFCFATAEKKGYVYEPDLEQIREMLHALRSQKPVPATAVQFSGGEPTLRGDLVDIIKLAKEMGFLQIQLATNGIELGRNEELAGLLISAGLCTVYLHFDGVSEKREPHIIVKEKAIENCRRAGLGVVLVPTIIGGRNHSEVGDIVRYAARNSDVVRGVNFQPIAFTGAAKSYSNSEISKMRFTIPDLARLLEETTDGEIKKTDFYPVSCVIPISKFVEALSGKPQIEFSAHPHCGAATYLFLSDGKLIPVTRFVDVEKFFKEIAEAAPEIRNASLKKPKLFLKAIKILNECVDEEKQSSIDFKRMMASILTNADFDSLARFHISTLFIGTMHFMDNFNYDIERVKRCVIHYATPDPERRIIPFCAYNSGPTYREEIQRKYSTPLVKWVERTARSECSLDSDTVRAKLSRLSNSSHRIFRLDTKCKLCNGRLKVQRIDSNVFIRCTVCKSLSTLTNWRNNSGIMSRARKR